MIDLVARERHRNGPLRHVAAVVCLFSILVLSSTACASPPMELDAYASAARDAAGAYVDESQNLSARYQAAVEDGVRELVDASGEGAQSQAVDLVVSETTNYLALLGDAMGRFLENLSELAPPDAVKSEHDEFVAAIESVYRSAPAAGSAVGDATSIEDVAYALTASSFADGQARWTSACGSLEQRIRDLGRGVDLKCVPPESAP